MPDPQPKTLTDARAEEALPRQRRFLFITSIALGGYYWLGLSVKEFSLLGMGFSIQAEQNALTGLWVVWGWSLLRYAQRVYELLSKIREDLNLDASAEDQRIALRYARKEAKRMSRQGHIGQEANSKTEITKVALFNPTGSNKLGTLGYYSEAGGRVYPDIRVDYVFVTEDRDEEGEVSQATGAAGDRISMTWSRLRTYVHVIHMRISSWLWLPAASEHVAPFIVAIWAAFSPLYGSHASPPPAGIPAAQEPAPMSLDWIQR